MGIVHELLRSAVEWVSRLAANGGLLEVVALAWGIPVAAALAVALLRRALARSA